MAKLVSNKPVQLNSFVQTYKLKMISGEEHIVTIKPYLYKDPWIDFNFQSSPFIVLKPLDELKSRIKKGLVMNGLNYGAVESFKMIESKTWSVTVYEKTYKSIFGNDIKWTIEE